MVRHWVVLLLESNGFVLHRLSLSLCLQWAFYRNKISLLQNLLLLSWKIGMHRFLRYGTKHLYSDPRIHPNTAALFPPSVRSVIISHKSNQVVLAKFIHFILLRSNLVTLRECI